MKERIKDLIIGALMFVGLYLGSGAVYNYLTEEVRMKNKPLYNGTCDKHFDRNTFKNTCLDCQLFLYRDSQIFAIMIESAQRAERTTE